MQYLVQEITAFTSSNITETTQDWSNAIITAGAFVVGKRYSIVTVGTTNFTAIGASANTVGVTFTATGAGTGTGTAQTAYIKDDYVLRGTFVYKAVTTATNQDPDLTTGIYWVKWAISNKWAMLDLSAQSKSYVDGGNLTVEFLQNRMTTLAIGNYEADTVKVEILDTDGTTVLWTYTTISTVNLNVVDYFTYIYDPYGYEVDRAVKVDLPLWGYKVRVTFYQSAQATRSACGYLVGGTPVFMGDTLANVKFGFHSYAVKSTDAFGTLSIIKRAVQDLVDFETKIDKTETMSVRRRVKSVYNDIIVFIVDESENSELENILVLGTVETCNVVTTHMNKTTLSWSVLESI